MGIEPTTHLQLDAIPLHHDGLKNVKNSFKKKYISIFLHTIYDNSHATDSSGYANLRLPRYVANGTTSTNFHWAQAVLFISAVKPCSYT